MGQATYGILFGIVDSDPERSETLRDEWDKKNHVRSYAARRAVSPDYTCIADTPYLGFWIAVGASGMDGVPYLDDVCLSNLDAVYSESIKLAKERWAKYADWVKQKGITLADAQLWLIETEVA